MKEFSKLEKKIGITFLNENYIKQAVVHRSYINEHPQFELGHNERLEFLGDAVLEIVVTEFLFLNYPKTPEGDLTNWRASLVNSKMLSLIAQEIGLEKYLYLSRGEAKDDNSKARQYILANAVEALIGGIYLDQGIEAAKKFVTKFMLSKLDNILSNKLFMDPKSRFQEKSQEIHKTTPHYKVLKESGPDHEKTFEVGLFLGEELISKGKGTSKQEAQVDAAERGIKKMEW
ncbi:MAG: Ribonuclease 3 [Candidatus Falkowbacteria bacterium GW2011_GWC2_38_22]|uniref:Ribonuclease 3 n=1 Tax=Candidatus Falkowbacteria bacterium GW2011_GWE1_38_31 TaxID=1618638 RepID=A0A0G0K438_9BACT|nr:MAG: Ribonuclease 3 [Candidatus Falkowbacteria bacterium GW2011_GWF2_38_1205]KKQ61045.1 MAG: Ribonuclease 3 [Candidatus Falkowbacteria bacterium GW2011_GWC2_38_22]KKQ63426.1 MAG: Ribonuclease 3 [Candidatus Falkowbacteria bacterium GW2011_GWF1_38_22]KKQ65503.1 MAG: Ribonuclease 3 [Candidatus Falkowbacteria bacterium GW2011_GWE2_38_254]KKQ70190.1 MAG: Ribonuclease 3 [Candidatus Falkowbacteria bacterium GW2011_GWE1_38_31]KKQ72634.1 MAG: Ribonuclease 3 [Candidatus Falkowbacteria bacterium GW201